MKKNKFRNPGNIAKALAWYRESCRLIDRKRGFKEPRKQVYELVTEKVKVVDLTPVYIPPKE